MNIQIKTLQLIEQGDYCSSTDRQAEGGVRLLMVTNANLLQLVKKGMFLEGLFARLNASQIHAPALRERHTDIPLLIGYYLGQMSKHYAAPCPSLARETLDALLGYSWPGNIRELRNLCENLVARRMPGPVLPVHLS